MQHHHRRQPPDWNAEFVPELAWFNDLRQRLSRQLPAHWPDDHELNQLAVQHKVCFDDGQPLRFAIQDQALSAVEYEQSIAHKRCIPIRHGRWHDVFNALAWLSFPRTKQALNRIHVNAPLETGGNRRTRARDFATLLDEAGIVITCTESSAEDNNRRHDWQQLFICHRGHWWQHWRPFIIGHGLYEQALTPYIGLTAKALYIDIPASLLQQPLAKQYARLDQQLAQQLSDPAFTVPQRLLPLPLLGIPGWWQDNEDPAFYSNTRYFRPARHRHAE